MNGTLQNSETKILEHELNEISLINRCIQMDSHAFKELMQKHVKYVGSIVQKYIWQKEDAEEVVQEVFIKVWRNLNRYDINKKFSTWLYRIAVNCCYDFLRKNKNRIEQIVIDNNAAKYTLEKFGDADSLIMNKELLMKYRGFINALSPKQKIIYTMIDIEDTSIGDTANTLKIKQSSVKANLSYARKTIRMKIKDYILG